MELDIRKTSTAPESPARVMRDGSPGSAGSPSVTPYDVRARIHAQEQRHDARRAELNKRLWMSRLRCVLEGVGLFVAVHLFFQGFAILPLMAAVVVGAFGGFVWLVTRAQTLMSPILAMPIHILFQLVLIALGGYVGGLIWGTFILGCLAALMGTARGMRVEGM